MIAERERPPLFPDAPEEQPEGIRGGFIYGRKHPWGDQAGWVVVLPATATNRHDYEGRGFVYMDQYGIFPMTPAHDRAPKAKDANDRPWHSSWEPWKLLLQRGGAKEFPLSQIIAFRWHIRPPYADVVFPELEQFVASGGEIAGGRPSGGEIFDFQCPECQRVTLFSSTNAREAIRQLRVHLTSRINEKHSYTPADFKTLGDDFGVDFTVRRVGQVRPKAIMEQQQVEEPAPLVIQAGETWEEFACHCGWAPTKAINRTEGQARNALRLHTKRHA